MHKRRKIKYELKEEGFGLALNEGEEEMLKALCLVFDIPITYPELFKEGEPHHFLWIFYKSGIGLTGPMVMRALQLSGRRIFYGVNEMKEFLIKNHEQWKKGFYIKNIRF